MCIEPGDNDLLRHGDPALGQRIAEGNCHHIARADDRLRLRTLSGGNVPAELPARELPEIAVNNMILRNVNAMLLRRIEKSRKPLLRLGDVIRSRQTAQIPAAVDCDEVLGHIGDRLPLRDLEMCKFRDRIPDLRAGDPRRPDHGDDPLL